MNTPPRSRFLRPALALLLPVALLTLACGDAATSGKTAADATASPADARLVYADGTSSEADARLVFRDAGPATGDLGTGGSGGPGGSGGDGGASGGAGGKGGEAVPGGSGGGPVPGGALADAAVGGASTPDAAPGPDAASPLVGDDCAPCGGNDDCSGLGESGQCSMLLGGSFCTRGCAGGAACPGGFRCLFDRCVPAGARCDSCATRPCDAGQRCNLDNGFCEALAVRCQGCGADADCADGMTCHALGFVRVCLPGCGGGEACPEGFQCAEGACAPVSGFCDACGGCAAPTPFCNLATRACQQCGFGAPCPDGQVCEMDGTCAAPEPGVQCRADLDCRMAGTPFCVASTCVSCRDGNDCRAGQACEAGACVAQACAGVSCQSGSACDPQTNLCAPGCAADADCGADGLLCNVATGQCYQDDQRCDPAGAASVCAPGGACVADPLDANRRVCTCAFTDPSNFQEPNDQHRIPCQPGGTCVQIGNNPGVCIRGR